MIKLSDVYNGLLTEGLSDEKIDGFVEDLFYLKADKTDLSKIVKKAEDRFNDGDTKPRAKTDSDAKKDNIDLISDEQKRFLDRYVTGTYKIQSSGEVDVVGDVDFSERKINEIPIKFNTVRGNFIAKDNNLVNVENSPEYVTGDFDVSGNNISTTENGPKTVDGVCDYSDNNLSKVFYMALEVGSLNLSNNQLKKIDKFPKKIKEGGFVNLSNNKLTNFDGLPSKLEGIKLDVSGNLIPNKSLNPNGGTFPAGAIITPEFDPKAKDVSKDTKDKANKKGFGTKLKDILNGKK